MRGGLRKFGVVVGACFALCLGIAWYFSGSLLYPGTYRCPKDVYIFCDSPAEVGLRYEDVAFRTADGLTIRAWYVEREPRAPGIVIVHGRGAARHEGLRYAPALHRAGFNLLLLDLRHCGQSDGSFNSMGFFERRDVIAAVNYLLEERQLPKAGVFGFSMGASTAILAMADDTRIAAGVFDSGFASFYDIVVDRGREDYRLPEYPIGPLVKWFFEWRGELDADEIRPIDRIASIAPRPVFILHGTGDRTVPFRHGEDLYRAAREPRRIWPVAGADHVRAWNTDRHYAESEIPGFFQTYLLGRRTIPEADLEEAPTPDQL